MQEEGRADENPAGIGRGAKGRREAGARISASDAISGKREGMDRNEHMDTRVVQRWESTETIMDVLVLCLKILREQDPFTQRNLSRQLRRWRREEGRTERGWLEVRMVNGQGPYIYYRWRRPGEREIQTEYYGRGDRILERLSLGPAISRAGLRRK